MSLSFAAIFCWNDLFQTVLFINKLWLLEWVSEKVTDNWSRCEASSDSVESSGANWGVESEELIGIVFFASITSSGSSRKVTFFSSLSAACITRLINDVGDFVVELFTINLWVVLFVSIEINVVEIFNSGSANSSFFVVFDDFIGDFDFFLSKTLYYFVLRCLMFLKTPNSAKNSN